MCAYGGASPLLESNHELRRVSCMHHTLRSINEHTYLLLSHDELQCDVQQMLNVGTSTKPWLL